MNLRKFYLIISVVLTAFLSTVGVIIISNLNKTDANTPDSDTTYNESLVLDETTNGTGSDQETLPKPDFSEIVNDPLTKSKPLNVLIVGGDKASGNTDTIMIVNYNPSTAELNVLSIPRDTRVTLEGVIRKINFAYPSGGNELIKSAVWDLLNLQVDRYIYLDLSAVRDIVDLLDGVEYNVPVDMKYDDDAQGLHIDLKAGLQTLDGEHAEEFLRFRKPNSYEDLPANYRKYYGGSDIQRVNAQQSFFKELIRQKATAEYLPKVFEIMHTIFDRVKTDFTLDEILGYSLNIDQIDINRVKMFVLSGDEEEGTWFFIYNGKLNYKNGLYDADRVIQKYFKSNFTD
jgi:polyisoprenyl-teichoic acid--peptidoglycan teichoic acid transferase